MRNSFAMFEMAVKMYEQFIQYVNGTYPEIILDLKFSMLPNVSIAAVTTINDTSYRKSCLYCTRYDHLDYLFSS